MNTKCVKREKITLHNKQSAKFTLRKKSIKSSDFSTPLWFEALEKRLFKS